MTLITSILWISAAVTAPCMNYGQATVSGTLVHENTAAPGAVPTWWHFIELEQPICTTQGTHPKGLEPALSEIRRIQLVHPDKLGYEQARELKGQRVTCEGTLFGKWTAQHHTPVLMRGTCVGAQQGAPADRPRPVGSAGA